MMMTVMILLTYVNCPVIKLFVYYFSAQALLRYIVESCSAKPINEWEDLLMPSKEGLLSCINVSMPPNFPYGPRNWQNTIGVVTKLFSYDCPKKENYKLKACCLGLVVALCSKY
jgi:hypothetical protein